MRRSPSPLAIRFHRQITRVAPIGALVVFLCACDDAAGPTTSVASLAVSPSADTLLVRDTVRLHAVVLSTDGDTLPGDRLEWRSSDTGVATVDSTGLVRGRDAGSAVITATAEGVEDRAELHVRDPPTISVEPHSARVLVDDTARLTATGFSSDGDIVRGLTFEWRSSDTAVATVDAAGLVRGRALGTATIRAVAEAEQATGRAELRVVEAATSCDADGGVAHAGTIAAGESWRAADAPHRLTGDVTLEARLTIEAGALVCGAEGAGIEIRKMVTSGTAGITAEGGADAPIVFTAADSARPWGGITITQYGTSNSIFRNARIEHAEVGIDARGSVVVDSSVIRRIAGTGVRLNGTLSHSVVDTAAIEGGEAVRVADYADGVLEDVTVRGSGGVGLGGYASRVSLRDVRIEGSAAAGLALLAATDQKTTVLQRAENVRIAGGASYPAVVDGAAAVELLAADGAPGNLLGNAKDTLMIGGDFDEGEIVVSRELPVGIWDELYAAGGTIRVEPGGVLTLAHGSVRYDGLRLIVSGSSGEPATIVGDPDRGSLLKFTGFADDTARFRYARVSDTQVDARGPHPVVFEHVAGADASFGLGAPGSRMTDVMVQNATNSGIYVSADDIEIGRCEVTGSGGDGVRVTAGSGVTIHDCNLVDNAGQGVNNETSGTIDARFNWWGDPAGPDGPEGDGVSGPVDHSEPRDSAVALTGAAAVSASPMIVVGEDGLILHGRR